MLLLSSLIVVEQEFYPALAVFGMPPHEPKGGLNAALDQEPPEGEEQEHLGRALPLFQDISNFADRCNALCANLVHQLAALYHSGSRMHKNTPVTTFSDTTFYYRLIIADVLMSRHWVALSLALSLLRGGAGSATCTSCPCSRASRSCSRCS